MDGVHAFTMQNVADRAGVSLRTVYRHFESREQLLEGLADHMDREMAALGFVLPRNVQEFHGLIVQAYRGFETLRDAMRATVIASVATGYRTRGHRARWEQLRGLLADAYPGLDERELDDATAVVGVLASSRTWYVLTAELGMDSERAGLAVDRSLGVLLTDLEKRGRSERKPSRTKRAHDQRKRGA